MQAHILEGQGGLMARIKLDLVTREEFSSYPLAQKNVYLQSVASQVAIAREHEFRPLDKDSLSRLRRYYTRRRLAELELEGMKDPDLRKDFQGLAEAIHLGEVKRVIAHETSSVPSSTFREPPPDDSQLMFFVPTVHDAPIKDDVNLMDVAPFSLSKTVRHGVIRYELKDALITIEGGAESGLVNAYDYDIFIHMVSHLASQMRDYRHAEAKGLRPSLPPRTYRPSLAEILKFCRREQGGRQFVDLERALDRLQGTRYKITNLTSNNTRRAAESFPLIGRYKVVSRTKNDRPDEVEIDIPDWVYSGVVSTRESPSILTLSPDYFLLQKPLARYIYRLARKATGTSGFAEYGLDTLHHRSGSPMPFRKFRESMMEIVAATAEKPLPDFDIQIIPAKGGGEKLRMTTRKLQVSTTEAA